MRLASVFATMGTIIGVSLAAAPLANADVTILIGPNQVFHGLVNGVHDNAQIEVVCLGPGQTGHPAAGQTISVAQGPSPAGAGGNTGLAGNSVVAGFTTSSQPQLFQFTSYNTPQEIPTMISLPCSGSEIMSFVPQPTSNTASTDEVQVSFVSSSRISGAE